MGKPEYFKYKFGKISLPVFFPDATRGYVKSIDSTDIVNTETPGILVNTYHLVKEVGLETVKNFGGIREFMNWKGAVISDSGGFQVGSLIKAHPELGHVTDKGVYFKFPGEKQILLTPESSIGFQLALKVDMVVALDDFDAPNASKKDAKDSVRRTILWAERSKTEFERICKSENLKVSEKPYILGVVQGGRDRALRKSCIKELINIGFDGLGYGGEEKIRGNINYDLAEFMASLIPEGYLLYALGVGKPIDIKKMVDIGWNIFDCVIPTRDARHKRLYVYNCNSIQDINPEDPEFYSYYIPDKARHISDKNPVSYACDCLLCKNYSRSYLAHLFKSGDTGAFRLSTIHNLRFYSLLIEKIKERLKRN